MKLEKITPDNVEAACDLRVAPEQESFVAPVVKSLAEAYAYREIAWPRLIYDGDRLVGFVMGFFYPGSPVSYFRCGIWRLNIAAGQQGRGYGRFAAEAVCAEARRRDNERVTVLWVPHPNGPERFWRHLGFHPTGEEYGGEIIGELVLA